MSAQKIFYLTGDQAIPGVPQLEYNADDIYPHHWAKTGFEPDICFYGSPEGLQLERIATAQKVLPLLNEIGEVAVDHIHAHYVAQYRRDWNLMAIYFGFAGDDPFDEFSYHFCQGPWDCSRLYYVQYRLNPDQPINSTIVKFGES